MSLKHVLLSCKMVAIGTFIKKIKMNEVYDVSIVSINNSAQ